MSIPLDQVDRQRLRHDLGTTFFVEAGAGTGKTRELVSRVVALVAHGRLTMAGLAAITFTTAAAAELRDRIRRELAQAAVDPRQWSQEQRSRCLEASRSVDLAHIQTIHAFAGDLLRAFPLEAELPPGFAMWDEMQRDRDFDERFRAWLYDDVPNSTRIERRESVAKILMLGLQPERLKLLTHRLQEHYDLLTSASTWQASRPTDPVQVANECGAELAALDAVLDCARLGDADDMCRAIRGLQFTIQQLLAARTEPEAFEALLRYLLKKPNPLQGRQTDWDLHPTIGSPLPYIRERLRSASARIEATIEAQRSSALAALLGYLAEFTLAYATDRKRRGVATFHDLLVWSRELLRDHPTVRVAAQQRIERLFVDEFQDTDPLQAELVAYLASDPTLADERDWHVLLQHLQPGKLFVVGDPKQSIYRFRRAEVAVYQRVYSAAGQTGADTAVLSQTFRSVAPLVDWVNDYFGSEMRAEPGVQAAYARLAPRPPLDGVVVDEHATRVRLMGGPDNNKAGDRWTAEAVALARVARKAVHEQWPITEQIDGVWQIRPARYRDVCVLLPTRTNLRRLERAFEDNGVPYRMESGSLVVFTQQVRDLVGCLRAIDDPSDQVALVAALRSPSYACSDVDLLRWVEGGGRLHYLLPGRSLDGPVGAAFVNLAAFHACRLERSAAATVEALLAERGLSLLALDHPRSREAVRRQRYVVAQARKLASAGDPTLRGFVHWIETLRKNELYDAESVVPDSDEDAVRLMTVHGSKGLEFPIVLLSGLGGGVRANDGVQLVANHAEGRLEARCTARIGPAFATVCFDGDREKRLEQAQQLRLLYVAATRAREHLVLSLFHSSQYARASHAASIWNHLSSMDPDGGRPREITAAELDDVNVENAVRESTGGGAESPVVGAQIESVSPEAHIAAETAWATRRHELLNTLGRERLATPSGLAHETESPESGVADGAESSSDNPSPWALRGRKAASSLGVAVHGVLEYLDLDSLSNLEQLVAWAARENSVDASEVRRLAHRAAQSAPVQRALASRRYWREVPISASIDGVLLEGAIDLLYEDADGSLVVVDYKTDHVSPAAVAARAQLYRLQGEAYALALREGTHLHVRRVELIFVSTGGEQVEVFSFDVGNLESVAAAI
ncbi:MAG TPA: UvrD-helicase domain-containing protein, partial [Chloroflexota bacterium]|nr:UvrD-helicase domain-containing protein [Chloroflexota bacterium]